MIKNKLHILKNPQLSDDPNNTWSDIPIFETLSRSTLHKSGINNYQQKVTEFLEIGLAPSYFREFKDVNQGILNIIINTVYTLEGLKAFCHYVIMCQE